jgi:hypothetical protein
MTTRLLAALTLVNCGLLGYQLAQRPGVDAEEVAPVLRGRALEIVDAQGRVRAVIQVNPPTTVDSQLYPESVLLRLTDPKSGNVVKLDASSEGSGMGLSDNTEHGGIRLMAKDRTGNFVQVTSRNGRRETIRP